MSISFGKRFLAVAAAGAILALSGCSGKDGSDGSSSGSSGSSAPAEESSQAGEQTSQTYTAPETNAKVVVENGDFYVNGSRLWFNAVNTPWDKWNDFGGSFNEVFWDQHFTELENLGVNATRVWINCNGLVGVNINEDGSFGNVTDKHWQDLDKLFDIAAKHKIYIMATLLSFDHFKTENTGSSNWVNMISSSDNIDAFVNGYVIPFAKRYDSNDYLMSIDLMNEPDWVHENDDNAKLDWDIISNYFARAAAGIHENSDVLVTVGIGVIKYNSEKFDGNMVSDEYLKQLSGNENSYLDFYSPHYYTWQKQWFGDPFTMSSSDYGLGDDKPCVIGEFAIKDDSGITIQERYQMNYDQGWDGAFAWTSNGVDACGGLADVAPGLKAMYEEIPELIRPDGEQAAA